jgi:hypothetical protein
MKTKDFHDTLIDNNSVEILLYVHSKILYLLLYLDFVEMCARDDYNNICWHENIKKFARKVTVNLYVI